MHQYLLCFYLNCLNNELLIHVLMRITMCVCNIGYIPAGSVDCLCANSNSWSFCLTEAPPTHILLATIVILNCQRYPD